MRHPTHALLATLLLSGCATATSPGTRALTRDGAVFDTLTFTPEGARNSERVVLTSLAPHIDGGMIVAGVTSARLDLGRGMVAPSYAMFVARLSRGGEVVWAMGGVGNHPVVATAPDGRVFVAAYSTSREPLTSLLERNPPPVRENDTLTLHALTPDGGPLWTASPRTPGGGYDVTDIEVDGDTLVVVGHTYSTYASKGWDLPTVKGTDALVTRWDARDGAMLTAHPFGGQGTDYAFGAALDEDGGVVVVGSFEREVAFGADTLRARGNDDGYVMKLTRDGEVAWVRQLSSDALVGGFARAQHVERMGDGWVVAGTFAQSIDMGAGPIVPEDGSWRSFAMGLEGDGRLRWERPITGESDWSEPFGLALMPDGAPVVALQYKDNYDYTNPGFLAVAGRPIRNPSGTDTLFVRLDPNSGRDVLLDHWHGARQKSEYDGHVRVSALAAHQGTIVAAATFTGSVSLGNRRLQAPFGVWEPCTAARAGEVTLALTPPRDPCEPEHWATGVSALKRIE